MQDFEVYTVGIKVKNIGLNRVERERSKLS